MYFGVDVGGTKTILASFSPDGQRNQEVKFATSQDYHQFLNDFAQNFKNLKESNFQAAAIAVPGKVERKTGVGIAFGNLPWLNVPIKSDLEKLINCPLIIENDAKVAGLREANLIINDFKRVLYITIGTGMGIAVINNGVIVTDYADLGGAIFFLNHNGELKSWDSFASGKAIFKEYGLKASDITDVTIWMKISRNFAQGILALIGLAEPNVVVIGGGVGSHFDRFNHLLHEELIKYETPKLSIPSIRPAQDAEEAVIYGCYELAKQNYGSNPS